MATIVKRGDAAGAAMPADEVVDALAAAELRSRAIERAKAPDAQRVKPGSLPSCKILVVDDSPTERFFLSELLAKRGYTVVTAENGDEAVAKARSEQPALVVMDVVMPGMSGYQATRAINRDPATQNIPVILCTSKSAESDKVWGLRQGARDYVVKPVDIPDLLTKIAKLA